MNARYKLDQLWSGDSGYRKPDPFGTGLDNFLRPTRLCRGLKSSVPESEVRVYVSFNGKIVFPFNDFLFSFVILYLQSLLVVYVLEMIRSLIFLPCL